VSVPTSISPTPAAGTFSSSSSSPRFEHLFFYSSHVFPVDLTSHETTFRKTLRMDLHKLKKRMIRNGTSIYNQNVLLNAGTSSLALPRRKTSITEHPLIVSPFCSPTTSPRPQQPLADKDILLNTGIPRLEYDIPKIKSVNNKIQPKKLLDEADQVDLSNQRQVGKSVESSGIPIDPCILAALPPLRFDLVSSRTLTVIFSSRYIPNREFCTPASRLYLPLINPDPDHTLGHYLLIRLHPISHCARCRHTKSDHIDLFEVAGHRVEVTVEPLRKELIDSDELESFNTITSWCRCSKCKQQITPRMKVPGSFLSMGLSRYLDFLMHSGSSRITPYEFMSVNVNKEGVNIDGEIVGIGISGNDNKVKADNKIGDNLFNEKSRNENLGEIGADSKMVEKNIFPTSFSQSLLSTMTTQHQKPSLQLETTSEIPPSQSFLGTPSFVPSVLSSHSDAAISYASPPIQFSGKGMMDLENNTWKWREVPICDCIDVVSDHDSKEDEIREEEGNNNDTNEGVNSLLTDQDEAKITNMYDFYIRHPNMKIGCLEWQNGNGGKAQQTNGHGTSSGSQSTTLASGCDHRSFEHVSHCFALRSMICSFESTHCFPPALMTPKKQLQWELEAEQQRFVLNKSKIFSMKPRS
jgi:hypothetical protein